MMGTSVVRVEFQGSLELALGIGDARVSPKQCPILILAALWQELGWGFDFARIGILTLHAWGF
jgi:hypothetical protein